MPRSTLRSPLPQMEDLIPHFAGFSSSRSRRIQMVELLSELIHSERKAENQIFYPLREISKFFGVSIRTANLAVQDLKNQGLLVSVRGSHTRIPGKREWGSHYVQAIIMMPLWVFGVRFSHLHKFLPMKLAETLRQQNLILQTAMYSEVADRDPDFDKYFEGQQMDFTLWLFPFLHNRASIQHLQDTGVPQVILQHAADIEVMAPDILVNWDIALKRILSFWKREYGIQQIILPTGNEYDRGRAKHFSRIAQTMGFDCSIRTCTQDLADQILVEGREREETLGIALLDEHSSAEFCFYKPQAIHEIFAHHRILFGNNMINIPFVPDKEFTAERIFVRSDELISAINRVFHHRMFQPQSKYFERVDSNCNTHWPVYRYI